MIYEETYLFLTLFLAYLIYYRNITSIEGFTSNNRVHKIKVKKAMDPELGLMYKKDKLKNKSGLLFDYKRYGIFTFWMKNTYIPLEVICLDHNYKVLGIIKDMKPKSKKKRTLNKPFRYAIEVNKGTCKKHGIKEGDSIKLEFVEDI